MIRKICTLFILLSIMFHPGYSAEIGGVTLPETITVGNKNLRLNGAGLRKKFIIKVYAGGLYLKVKTGNPTEIIQADAPMAVRMHFIYKGVSGEQLVEAWNEGFGHVLGEDSGALKTEVDRFNSLFTREAKKGDMYDILYIPEEGVVVNFNDEQLGVIPGLEFKQALFAIWFGEKPADKSLKAGMLGE